MESKDLIKVQEVEMSPGGDNKE